MNADLRIDPNIIDAHVHLVGAQPDASDALLAQEHGCGIRSMCLQMLSLPGSGYVNTNPEGLYAKFRHPDRVYLFGALDYTALFEDTDLRFAIPFARQVQRLRAMGCDGMKMLTGKPNYRKQSGLALDSAIFESHFACLEQEQIPLLWHVGDPEEFWDPERVPSWAKDSGWAYDSSFPSKETLYAECHSVLDRHPRLKVFFAHFFFLSADLTGAAELLDRYPAVCLDLTPGTEMYANFSKRPDETRDFFLRYDDRLVFGSDLMSGGDGAPITLVRRFLETDDEFRHEDLGSPVHGIALPPESLRKIEGANFRRAASEKPRPLIESLALDELDRLAALQQQLGAPVRTARRFASLISGDSVTEQYGTDSAFSHLVL